MQIITNSLEVEALDSKFLLTLNDVDEAELICKALRIPEDGGRDIIFGVVNALGTDPTLVQANLILTARNFYHIVDVAIFRHLGCLARYMPTPYASYKELRKDLDAWLKCAELEIKEIFKELGTEDYSLVPQDYASESYTLITCMFTAVMTDVWNYDHCKIRQRRTVLRDLEDKFFETFRTDMGEVLDLEEELFESYIEDWHFFHPKPSKKTGGKR